MAQQQQTRSNLEIDIFGAGDSDLSDVSDVEDASSKQQQRQAEPLPSEDEGDEAEPAGDGDYQQPSRPSQPQQSQKPKKKKQSTGEAPPKKQSRPKKSAQERVVPEEEEPEPELTPEERRRRDLDEKLNSIIKKPKAKKRKRAGDEEDLGQAADENEVYELRKVMIQALAQDNEAIEAGQPALNRLKMLPRVEATLQKSHLELIALDQNILGVLRDWLEPAPNKALPALNIQRSIFAMLNRMNIETVALKESGIGKVITFYSRCPRVESSIRRNADNLITVWMRPILRRSAAWRDKQVHRAPRREAVDYDEPERQRQRQRQSSTLAPGMQDSATGRRHARIPQATSTTYTVAPANRIDRGAAGTMGNNKEAMERFKQFNKQLKGAKAASKRL